MLYTQLNTSIHMNKIRHASSVAASDTPIIPAIISWFVTNLSFSDDLCLCITLDEEELVADLSYGRDA